MPRVRAAHAHYFAGRETDILALWDSPRQREAYDWFITELANLRSAFRWAADHSDLDSAAPIATYAAWLGVWVENHEPIAWAEELIEPARAVDHPRLPFLYVMASQCYLAGRIDAAVRYIDDGQTVIGGNRDPLPYGIDGGRCSVPAIAAIGIATATWRKRLALRGTSPGPRPCHDGGCSFGSGDVLVHRCRGFDPSVGSGRRRDVRGAGRP